MGLRRWFFDLLARGPAPDVDPDAQVEVATVALFDGPRLVAELEAHGIDAVGIESFSIVTDTRSLMRVAVRHADLAAARAVVDAFR
jgi:hypothetical protein